MSSLRVALVVVFVGGVVACANAGGASPPIDSFTPADAPKVTDAPTSDAPLVDAPMIDAFVPIDAPIDAPSGPFCSNNSQCTVSGECCYAIEGVGFCAEGTPIGQNICIPPL